MNDQQDKNETYLELTVDIVAAYVSNNPIPANELPSLIASVNASLLGLLHKPAVQQSPLVPAVNPKRSVHDDHIICLEDGKKFKSMKRHIATYHGLTPDEYRAKWSLPGRLSDGSSGLCGYPLGLGQGNGPWPQAQSTAGAGDRARQAWAEGESSLIPESKKPAAQTRDGGRCPGWRAWRRDSHQIDTFSHKDEACGDDANQQRKRNGKQPAGIGNAFSRIVLHGSLPNHFKVNATAR